MLHRSGGDPLPSTLTPVLAPPLRELRQGPCSARGSAYAWAWKWPALVPGPIALPIPALSVAVLYEERPGSPAHNARRCRRRYYRRTEAAQMLVPYRRLRVINNL